MTERVYFYEHVNGEVIRKPAILVDGGGGPDEYFNSPFVKRWWSEGGEPEASASIFDRAATRIADSDYTLSRSQAEEYTRLVLEEIREPSERMLEAGYEADESTGGHFDGPAVWKAMVDAIRNEA